MGNDLTALLSDIRSCTLCADDMPHDPRPVLQASATARIGIFGQAPGARVHASGRPFTDPSGERLREWMGIEADVFYDETRIAIVPMGFCFPGNDAKGGDLPPLKQCAQTWRARLMEELDQLELILLVGAYAQKWHLDKPDNKPKKTLTQTVEHWRDYGPKFIPTPHPSWRNNVWLKKNPWFERETLPELKRRVRAALKAG